MIPDFKPCLNDLETIINLFSFQSRLLRAPKKTIRANYNIYHTSIPNNFTDVQNLHQDQELVNMKLDEFKLLTSTCWKEKYQNLSIDRAKEKQMGRYRLG